tara:strand:+ start:934 stop:1809 length:876 start_codon:yes stop_codon:yes gene_type:complete
MSRKLAQTLLVTATGIRIKSDPDSLSSAYLLDPDSPIDYYVLTTSGAVTLTNNVSITNNAKITAIAGDCIEIKYSGDVTLSSFNLSFFGNNMPTHLTSVDCIIQAYYDGTNWNTVFLPSVVAAVESVNNDNIVTNSITAAELAASAVESTELASNAVTTAKISNANVTVEKLENEALESVIAIPIQFNYAAKDTFHLAIPTKSTFVRITSVVSGVAIDGSNAATMTITNGGASVFSATTLHAAGTGENTVATLTPSSNTAIAQGNVLAFTPDGSASTGKVFLTITIRRVAD